MAAGPGERSGATAGAATIESARQSARALPVSAKADASADMPARLVLTQTYPRGSIRPDVLESTMAAWAGPGLGRPSLSFRGWGDSGRPGGGDIHNSIHFTGVYAAVFLGRGPYSTLMLTARITLPHFSVSAATRRANSAGEVENGS
jgi:hypothetical protein